MKKSYLFLYCLCISWISVYAQEQSTCEQNIEKAKELLTDNSPFNNQEVIFNLVAPCADAGDTDAENLLGIFYLNGVGTEINEAKAYELISSAAAKNHVNAQYNLGRMYKYGVGCPLDFEKAVEYFEKANQQGNQRAAYSLGYMYYKGLGVAQDYEKAVYWFEHSEDPMAKHFLGLCYYQGYGVEADEDKALGILLTNNIVNSATLIHYIEDNQKENIANEVAQALDTNTSEEDENDVATVITTEVEDFEYKEVATPEDMQGDWTGRIVQYDWSGKTIERVLPIEVSFGSENGQEATLNYLFLEENKKEIIALIEEDYLYFQTPFTFTLDKLYSSNPKELTLDYQVLSMHFKKQVIAEQPYLIGMIDTYIKNWKEYGQPTSIVLKRLDNAIDLDMLTVLAAQEDQFIKLYPVPIVNQLTVQYDLEVATNVHIELVSLYTNHSILIAPSSMQQAGEHTYTVPISGDIPSGMYVVRLTAGNQLYTRLITKEN